MSQAKVDKYKNYKKNRRENIKKEQRKAKAGAALAWVIVAVIIIGVAAAIGVTIYNNYQAKLAALPSYGTTSYVLSDYVGIQQEDEAEEIESQSETDAETAAEEGSAAETTAAETAAEETSAVTETGAETETAKE